MLPPRRARRGRRPYVGRRPKAALFALFAQGGKAWGSQRFLDTEAYRAYKEQGAPPAAAAATPGARPIKRPRRDGGRGSRRAARRARHRKRPPSQPPLTPAPSLPPKGKVVFREFATPPPLPPLAAALAAARDVLGVVTGAPNTTDNASVSLQAVGPRGAGGRRPRLLAVSETPRASYLVDPSSLATLGKARARRAAARPRRAAAAARGGGPAAWLAPRGGRLARPAARGRGRGAAHACAHAPPPPSAAAAAPRQASFPDAVKGDLTTAHPTLLGDGSLLNFARTLPFGGFNIFKQARLRALCLGGTPRGQGAGEEGHHAGVRGAPCPRPEAPRRETPPAAPRRRAQDPETLARTQVAFVKDRRPLSPAWLHDFPANDECVLGLPNGGGLALGGGGEGEGAGAAAHRRGAHARGRLASQPRGRGGARPPSPHEPLTRTAHAHTHPTPPPLPQLRRHRRAPAVHLPPLPAAGVAPPLRVHGLGARGRHARHRRAPRRQRGARAAGLSACGASACAGPRLAYAQSQVGRVQPPRPAGGTHNTLIPPPRRAPPRAAPRPAQPHRVFSAPPFFVFHYGACFEEPAPGGGRQLVRAPRRDAPAPAGRACGRARVGSALRPVRARRRQTKWAHTPHHRHPHPPPPPPPTTAATTPTTATTPTPHPPTTTPPHPPQVVDMAACGDPTILNELGLAALRDPSAEVGARGAGRGGARPRARAAAAAAACARGRHLLALRREQRAAGGVANGPFACRAATRCPRAATRG